MLVGHVAVGFIAKRCYPALSLGMLVFAAMLADVIWCVLMLAGIERVTIAAGRGAANYFNAIDIAWSHSLATLAMWALLVAGVSRLSRMRAAWILALAVLSHWVLDVIAHRPDMPLAPGVAVRVGLGLWTSLPATLVVEGGFWVVALWLFVRHATRRRMFAPLAVWPVALLLTLAWYNNIAGPPPPDIRTAPIASLVFFTVIIAWAFCVDRLYVAGTKIPARERDAS